MKIVEKIKQKRGFSELPNSVIERVAEISKGDIKKSRALLRKYFGVFLTNRVLKGKGSADEILKIHLSSRKRDYENFYEKIFSGVDSIKSVLDLGCGVNGFSYQYLNRVFNGIKYFGIEASGQLVRQANEYFKINKFFAEEVVGDLFDVDNVVSVLRKLPKERVVFLFQVIDALENLERDFSKDFISKISKECEGIVLSLPTESLGGRKKFAVRRKWFVDFLEENFVIKRDFILNGERIIYLNTGRCKKG